MQEQKSKEDDILDELLEDIVKPELTPSDSLSKLLESQSDCV